MAINIKMKISVVDISIAEIVNKYAVHKATAYRAKKRGYLIPSYHVKGIKHNPQVAEANLPLYLQISKAVFYRHFLNFYEYKEDCLQEAILRCIELSGMVSDGKFIYSICRNAMRSYLHHMHLLRCSHATTVLNTVTGKEEV